MKILSWVLTALGGVGTLAVKIMQKMEFYLDDKNSYLWFGRGSWDNYGDIYKTVDALSSVFAGVLVLGILLALITYLKNAKSKGKNIDIEATLKGIKDKAQSLVKAGAVAIGKVTYCEACGKEVAQGDNYCRHCNASLAKDTQSQALFCSSCGSELLEQANFCGKCGQKIN
ncbi:MAG: zinc ribbon domain-containing protein [Oscillospiraceae bacterium]|jgi:hypothetical protein|nr:zinc ribbon domain-containing protein [Oscillospiraceae bacterium]